MSVAWEERKREWNLREARARERRVGRVETEERIWRRSSGGRSWRSILVACFRLSIVERCEKQDRDLIGICWREQANVGRSDVFHQVVVVVLVREGKRQCCAGCRDGGAGRTGYVSDLGKKGRRPNSE